MITMRPTSAAWRRPAQEQRAAMVSEMDPLHGSAYELHAHATADPNGVVFAAIPSPLQRESALMRPPQREGFGSSRELAARFARMRTLVKERRQETKELRMTRHRSRGRGVKTKSCAEDRALARRRVYELRRPCHAEMQSSIQHLQETIEQLERTRSLMDSRALLWRTNRTGVVVDVCREYFAQFEAGYDPSRLHEVQKLHAIRSFLDAAVEEDIVCREYRGVDQLLKQWEIYTKFHSDFVTRLDEITLVEEEDEVVSICCRGVMDLQISDATLRNLYPEFYVLAQQNEASQRIAESLIGKRYELSFDKVLHFNRHGKIFAHETKVHLASGLLKTLQDPFAALQVLEGSVMTVDGHWNTPDVEDIRIQHDEMYEMPRLRL